MKAIVFGSTGNSGSYCVQHLLTNGWTVIGVGRSESVVMHDQYQHIVGDITDGSLYEKLPKKVDLIINFAGVQPSILKTSEKTNLTATLESYVKVNMSGVFNILEFARKNHIKNYIYTTSHRDIEGHWSSEKLLTNDLPTAINYRGDHTMYAISKTSAKMIGDYYREAFSIRVFNLRLPMIFLVPRSPFYLNHGQPVLMPFLELIRKAMMGGPLEIWGNPNLKRDYVHIDNLISLIDLCFKSNLPGGTFNVGTGEGVTTERFVRTIGNTFSSEPNLIDYIYRPDKNTYKCAVYDVSEEAKILGYRPILLDEMLDRLKGEIMSGDYAYKWGWHS